MKKLLGLLSLVALTFGAQAACGKKVTDEGTLKSYDKEKKQVVVTKADGKTATVTLTPTTTGADKAADLVGKAVKVVSEHGKADSVEAAPAKS
jgi:VCBS repeat-containing protein